VHAPPSPVTTPAKRSADDWVSLLDTARTAAHHYLRNLDSGTITPASEDLAALEHLVESLPESGTSAVGVLEQLISIGSANTVLSSGPNYYGFVTGGSLPIALAARWLSDTWDQNAALEVMSPISARLESIVQDWLVKLFGLPRETVMGLVSGSSVASLCALAAARQHIYQSVGWPIEKAGLQGAPLIEIYGPDSLHGSIEKALRLLGFGLDQMHWLPTDAQGRLRAETLPPLNPTSILVLQAGQVCTGAFDDFLQLIPLARAQGAWVHIDGAFGLWAAASDHQQKLTGGIDLADSWVVDAHKTLNVPYDSGLVFCRHASALETALSASGSYLEAGSHRDGMAYTPEMSRRARAIELWATIKTLGRVGIGEMIDQFCDLADLLKTQLQSGPYTLVGNCGFNQVLVCLATDDATQEALSKLQASGEIWVSGAQWQERSTIRISICNWRTEHRHILKLAEVMRATADEINHKL